MDYVKGRQAEVTSEDNDEEGLQAKNHHFQHNYQDGMSDAKRSSIGVPGGSDSLPTLYHKELHS